MTLRQSLLDFFERIHDWEMGFLDQLQSIRHPILDGILIFFTKLGDVGIIWILISVILLFTKKYRKMGMAGLLALMFGGLLTNLFLKEWLARERPFNYLDELRLKEVLIIKKPSEYSFPSGHTTASFATGIVLAYYFRKYRIPIISLAIIISFSRMYLYVHFLTDILGGVIVGTISAVLSLIISEKVFDRFLPSNYNV